MIPKKLLPVYFLALILLVIYLLVHYNHSIQDLTPINNTENLTMYTIRGASIEPTLKDDEQVYVDAEYYKTHNFVRSDIVAFKLKTQEKPFVKRIIALPGDKLEFNKDGNIYLNGKILEEPYLADKNYHFDPLKIKVLLIPLKQTNDTVPQGTALVLGDNRRNSFDSEYYGFVPMEYILGKVVEH